MELPLEIQCSRIAQSCTDCGACIKQCSFLACHGSPGQIATQVITDGGKARLKAFECHLCGLCESICPEKLPLTSLLLAMRRKAQQQGEVDLKPYKTLLGYEQRGHSGLFSYYDLPHNCNTAFYPGCTLAGTRPGITWKLIEHLKNQDPDLGVVLDCCHKPSHDLGRHDHFLKRFSAITAKLKNRGVGRLIVACPNCYKVFKTYGEDIETVSAYEHLAETGGLSAAQRQDIDVLIHDPCPLRNDSRIHEAVRSMAEQMGIKVHEPGSNSRQKTLCCGEGGGVPFVRPDYSRQWAQRRVEPAKGRMIMTYCAGCTGFLSPLNTTAHLLDLIFSPQKVRTGSFRPLRAPFTYLGRLWLKFRLMTRPKKKESPSA